MLEPTIELPATHCTRPGNPYKWVQFRNPDDGTLTFPQPPIRGGALYLCTLDGEEYHVEYLTTLSKIMGIIYDVPPIRLVNFSKR